MLESLHSTDEDFIFQEFDSLQDDSKNLDFAKAIEKRGFKLQKENKEKQEVIFEVPIGNYEVSIGFEEANLDDKTFRYPNNPKTFNEKSLLLDYENPLFLKFVGEFEKNLESSNNLTAVIKSLDKTVQKYLRSDLADENISKMSDIIKNGASSCAGKTLVAGVTLKTLFHDQFAVSYIDGSLFKFTNNKLGPYGHRWLRVSQGSNVALYDPYYQKISAYNQNNFKILPNDPFANYEVAAYAFGDLHNNLKFTKTSALKIVSEQNDKDGSLFYIKQEYAHLAQINGFINEVISTSKLGHVTLVNGCLETKENNNSNTPRHKYPLITLKKLDN